MTMKLMIGKVFDRILRWHFDPDLYGTNFHKEVELERLVFHVMTQNIWMTQLIDLYLSDLRLAHGMSSDIVDVSLEPPVGWQPSGRAPNEFRARTIYLNRLQPYPFGDCVEMFMEVMSRPSKTVTRENTKGRLPRWQKLGGSFFSQYIRIAPSVDTLASRFERQARRLAWRCQLVNKLHLEHRNANSSCASTTPPVELRWNRHVV